MTTATLTHPQALPPMANGAVNASHMAAPAIAPQRLQQQELLGLYQDKRKAEADLVKYGAGEAVFNGVQYTGSIAAEYGSKVLGVTPVIGTAGKAASLLISGVRGNKDSEKSMEKLTRLHLADIVQELGVKPEEATADHLRLLSERPDQEQLRTEVQKIDQKLMRSVGGTAAGFGGSAAGAALMPVVAGAVLSATPVGWAGGALWLGSSIVGSMVASNVANKAMTAMTGLDPNDSAYDELEAMQRKLDNRQPVNSIDVFNVLKASDKELQKKISAQTGGKKFSELAEFEQADLLETYHPGLLDASRQLAYETNIGAVVPTRLVTLDTVALEMGGAEAAYTLTRNDIMYGANINKMQGENNIVAYSRTPSTSIDAASASTEPMQGQERDPNALGNHTAAVLQQRQATAMASQELGA